MRQYRIKDGIQIFKNNDNNKLVFRNYKLGKLVNIDYQESLKKLMIFLRDWKTIEDIKSNFKYKNIENVISVLHKNYIIDIKNENNEKKSNINILIIGLGTTGSHLVEGLLRLDLDVNLFLVDADFVDETNIMRQAYYMNDIGKLKTVVFKDRYINSNIISINKFILNKNDIKIICEKYKIDLIVQCGDKPTPRYLGMLVNEVCDERKIPCILNSGYISNSVALPEFYFSNNIYRFDYKHETNKEELLLTQVLEKSDYIISIQPSLIMIKQIIDYINGRLPLYYGYRGYFNEERMNWEVKLIE